MYLRTALSSCRPGSRRLALGGLVLTSALAAGAFVSTPAFADPVTDVSTTSQLDAALAGSATSIRLMTSIDATDDFNQTDAPTIASSKTLDLNGNDLTINQIAVDDGVALHVVDSTAADGSTGDGDLEVHAAQANVSTPISAVDLGQDASFRVTGADVTLYGVDGGAGIGSDDSTGSATFVADGGASVFALGGTSYDSSWNPIDGGAGIGGMAGDDGIDVTIADATVNAYGGYDAAGVGGGSNGAGGAVDLTSGALLIPVQSFDNGRGDHTTTASAVGAGAGGSDFGSLDIAAGATLSLRGDGHLVVPAGTTVENRGAISMQSSSIGGDLVRGAGTIHNLGTISAYDGSSADVDPTTLIATGVSVSGHDYAITIDANGGTFQGTRTGHILTGSLSDVIGSAYSSSGYTITEPAGYTFYRWNTAADGTGAAVVDDLTPAGLSTGGPKAVTLYATYARVPYATATYLPAATVGTPYRAALPVAGDGLRDFEVSYGNSSSSVTAGLPKGLSIDAATGVISGTPTEAVERDVTFYVQGIGGADLTYHLAVKAAPAPAATTPAVVVAAAPTLGAVAKQTVRLGQKVAIQVAATSTLPVTYSIAFGSLPKGLVLDAGTGLISGVATQSGSFSAFVQARSSAGAVSTEVAVVVPEVQDLIATKNAVPAVSIGAASVPLQVAGLQKGERWTVKVDGKVVDRGTMAKAGPLAVAVHLKKVRKDTVHTIVIAGSRTVTDPSKRAATTVTVTSLAPKKALKVATKTVNGAKQVVVTKLAAGEKVVIRDGARIIASGHATKSGAFAFPQTKAGAGTSTLTVQGAAVKRAGKVVVKNPKH